MKKIVFGAVVLAAIIIGAICIGVHYTYNDMDYTVTVTDKERITESSGSGENRRIRSKYLVFTETDDGEVIVFENVDSLLRGKFNSSDLQGRLKEGKKYKITAVGIRSGFWSLYKNIIRAEEVTE